MTTTEAATQTPRTTAEREALITTLAHHRGFLLHTAEGLTEEQARTASTISTLTIASLLKHVADTEEVWVKFALRGPQAFPVIELDDPSDFVDTRFALAATDTLDSLRTRVAVVAARTEDLLRTADLDAGHPLPSAPWFEQGASWSVRRVALHLLAEISQHAGHADIVREAIDGQKTMG